MSSVNVIHLILFIFQLTNAYNDYDDLAIMFARFTTVNTFEYVCFIIYLHAQA